MRPRKEKAEKKARVRSLVRRARRVVKAARVTPKRVVVVRKARRVALSARRNVTNFLAPQNLSMYLLLSKGKK